MGIFFTPPQMTPIIAVTSSQTITAQATARQELVSQIKKSIGVNESKHVRTSVSLFDIRTGDTFFRHDEHTKHFAASINKLAITRLLLEDLRAQEITMDTLLTLPPPSARSAGNGKYDSGSTVRRATVRDMLFDMLNRSGNTVVRTFVENMGGPNAVNHRLAEVPQLSMTRLHVLSGGRFYMGYTNGKEALFIMRELMRGGDKYKLFVKKALSTNIYTSLGVRSQLSGADHITLVDKSGVVNADTGNNRHDVGIVYNSRTGKAYGYSFLTTSPYSNDTATDRAEHSLRVMGRNLLRYVGDVAAGTTAAGRGGAPHITAKIKY